MIDDTKSDHDCNELKSMQRQTVKLQVFHTSAPKVGFY